MEDLIDLKEDRFDHVMADKLEIRLADQVCNVFFASSEEIVEADNLIGSFDDLVCKDLYHHNRKCYKLSYIIATSNKKIAQMRAHKTGTSSDKDTRGFDSGLRFDQCRLSILILLF